MITERICIETEKITEKFNMAAAMVIICSTILSISFFWIKQFFDLWIINMETTLV